MEIVIVEGKDEHSCDCDDDSGEGHEFKFSIRLQVELSGFSLALHMEVREGEWSRMPPRLFAWDNWCSTVPFTEMEESGKGADC